MMLWLAMAAQAADEDPLGEVLKRQLERNVVELALPNAPALYHLRYSLLTLEQVDVRASLGSLLLENADPYSVLGVEVRVGSSAFDNTGFGGWQDGFGRTGLPVDLTPAALAIDSWRLTDVAYKEAVEQHARKTAQWTPPGDHPGDYTLTGPIVADLGAGAIQVDPAALRDFAVRMSAALRSEVSLRGEVHIGHESGALRIVDTEGSDVRIPVLETSIRAVASVRATDGGLITDQRLWSVRGPDQLPPEAAMLEEVRALRDQLTALASVPALAEEYVGPVVFEGEAALGLFRYVLLSQLEGTPPEVPFDSFFGDLGERRDPVRIGRRVLPAGWTVVADSTLQPDHPGFARYDMEGSPTKAVELVAEGIVVDLVMSRVPRRGVQGNGHARGMVGTRLRGRATMVQVEADRTRSRAALRRRAQRLAQAYGRDYVMVVERLQEPCVLRLGNEMWFDPSDAGTALPPPVSVLRVYADGREEPLRGAAFAGVQRWALRDIIAAGPTVQGSFLAPVHGGYASLSPTEGIASWLSVPEVVVGEAELVPVRGDPRDVAVLPPPAPVAPPPP